MHIIQIWVKNIRVNTKTWNTRVMKTAFLFDRRTQQNKFRVAEKPIHKDREVAGWKHKVRITLGAQGRSGRARAGPCSPTLQPLKGAGAEHSRAVLYLLVKDSNVLQHAQSNSGYSWLIHQPLNVFSPRKYEGTVDFTGSTCPSALCVWWGREREFAGRKITGISQL